MPFTSATRSRFLLCAVMNQIKIPLKLVPCEKSVFSLTLPNTASFLWVLRFAPVQTLAQ